MNTTPTRLLAIVVTTLSVAGILFALGPRPISMAENQTGDTTLSNTIFNNAKPGHHQISSFALFGDDVVFGGLGADADTEIEIGSITKTFTAELLRQQIEAGDISLDTRVGEILDVGDTAIADVTMKELATHTSGLPRVRVTLRSLTAGFSNVNPYAGETTHDIIHKASNSKLSKRGESNYSNLGFGLLGAVLAENAKVTYPELVQRQIFQPLNMNDTYVMEPGTVPETAPRGLSFNGKSADPWEMEGCAAAGAIRSTPRDMVKFAKHMLEITPPEYTWIAEEDGIFWHNGGTGGYSTMLLIDVAQQRAAFVAGDTPQDTEYLAKQLLEVKEQ